MRTIVVILLPTVKSKPAPGICNGPILSFNQLGIHYSIICRRLEQSSTDSTVVSHHVYLDFVVAVFPSCLGLPLFP